MGSFEREREREREKRRERERKRERESREVNDLERELFSLPARYGGLGIANPCVQSDRQMENSERLTAPLLTLILAQERCFDTKDMKKIHKNQLAEKHMAHIKKA